jgi:antirestriction protein ArdC
MRLLSLSEGRERLEWQNSLVAKREELSLVGVCARGACQSLARGFLCADLALTPEPGEDHAAYIQSWLKVLNNDKRAIFTAAAHAQRAADFLHSLQETTESEAAAA